MARRPKQTIALPRASALRSNWRDDRRVVPSLSRKAASLLDVKAASPQIWDPDGAASLPRHTIALSRGSGLGKSKVGHARPLASQTSAAKRRLRIGKIYLTTIEHGGRCEKEQPKVGPKGEGAGATESKDTESTEERMSCLQFDKHSMLCVTSNPPVNLPVYPVSPASSRRSCLFVGGSSCLKISFRIQLAAKPHPLCSLCPLWLILLDSHPSGLFVDDFDLFVAFFSFFLCVSERRPYQSQR